MAPSAWHQAGGEHQSEDAPYCIYSLVWKEFEDLIWNTVQPGGLGLLGGDVVPR